MGIAIDFDCHFGGAQNHFAVVAPIEVIFEFGLGAGIDDAVEIIGQLFQEISAFHCLPSPEWFFRKNLFNRSRNCRRARSKRDFTAGTLSSSASAVSSVGSPS